MAGPEDQLTPDVLCKASPQWWAALRRGMARTHFHDELHTLLLEHNRVCILAPRSHGKSEAVVNHVAWRCWRQPGLTVMVFSATENLASKLKRRVDAAVEEARATRARRCDCQVAYTCPTQLSGVLALLLVRSGQVVFDQQRIEIVAAVLGPELTEL